MLRKFRKAFFKQPLMGTIYRCKARIQYVDNTRFIILQNENLMIGAPNEKQRLKTGGMVIPKRVRSKRRKVAAKAGGLPLSKP